MKSVLADRFIDFFLTLIAPVVAILCLVGYLAISLGDSNRAVKLQLRQS